MDSDIKRRWITALKSGKYEKGYGVLRVQGPYEKTETWCCLGVLCDIVDPDAWEFNEWGVWYHHGADSFLPPQIQEIVEIPNQGEIARFNDMVASFEPIIEYIEQRL